MDPDDNNPLYSLSNERTFLAWIRTALGMLAGAAGLFAIELPWPDPVARVLAGFLATVAGLTAFLAWVRWRKIEEAIQEGRPLPTPRAHVVLALAVGVVAATVVVLAFV